MIDNRKTSAVVRELKVFIAKNSSSSREMLLPPDIAKAFWLVPSLTGWRTFLYKTSEAQGVPGNTVIPVHRL